MQNIIFLVTIVLSKYISNILLCLCANTIITSNSVGYVFNVNDRLRKMCLKQPTRVYPTIK